MIEMHAHSCDSSLPEHLRSPESSNRVAAPQSSPPADDIAHQRLRLLHAVMSHSEVHSPFLNIQVLGATSAAA